MKEVDNRSRHDSTPGELHLAGGVLHAGLHAVNPLLCPAHEGGRFREREINEAKGGCLSAVTATPPSAVAPTAPGGDGGSEFVPFGSSTSGFVPLAPSTFS